MMKRKMLALVFGGFAGLVLAASGCAGKNNVESCNKWVKATSCGSTDISSLVNCNLYKDTTCDISAYFDCLTANTKCTNNVIDVTGWAGCASKAQCK